MTGGYLQGLFHHRTPKVISPEVHQALGELAFLAQTKPSLAGPAAMLREILPALFGAPISSLVPALTPERIREKTLHGVPLLQGEAFQLDVEAFQQHWADLCTVVQHFQGPEVGQKLLAGLQSGQLTPGELLGYILGGQNDALQTRAQALGLEGGTLVTLVRLLLIPVLGPLNAAWQPLRRGLAWDSGSCPTCGGLALLAEVHGPGSFRTLRCGLCTASWPFPQGSCPFCGIDEAPFLGSFQIPGEDSRFQATTCHACRCYLKTMSTSVPLTGPQLLVADLESMFLDGAAAERGYSAAE